MKYILYPFILLCGLILVVLSFSWVVTAETMRFLIRASEKETPPISLFSVPLSRGVEK